MTKLDDSIKQLINNSITRLDLYNENIGDNGAKRLAKALKANTSLNYLRLYHNNIGEIGSNAIGEALKNNKTIKSLIISEKGAVYIVSVLISNNVIEYLDISSNNLTKEAMGYLSNLIAVNSSLLYLDLNCNDKIGEEGTKYLADSLRNNKSIVAINLYYCNIGDKGAIYLADSLKENKIVSSLNLTRNVIRDEGAKSLTDLLEYNNSITYLNIKESNGISYAHLQKIQNYVTRNVQNKIIEIKKLQGQLDVLLLSADLNELNEASSLLDKIIILGHHLKYRNASFGIELIKLALFNKAKIHNQLYDCNKALQLVNLAIQIDYDYSVTQSQGGFGGSNPYIVFPSQSIDLGWNNSDCQETLKSFTEILQITCSGYNPKTYREIILQNKQQLEVSVQQAEILYQKASKLYALKHYNMAIDKLELAIKLVKEIAIESNINDEEKSEIVPPIVRYNYAKALTLTALEQYQEALQSINFVLRIMPGYQDALYHKTLLEKEIWQKVQEQVIYLPLPNDENVVSNLNTDTLNTITKLIQEGRERINNQVQSGILLLGNTGSGKSTLVHLLSGCQLQAKFDNEVGELVIDALQPIQDVIISHNKLSETRIPSKRVIGDIVIWDCPGFSDTTGIVQEIANSFYIQRLFEYTQRLKFILVVPESALLNSRGSDFIDTVNQLVRSFHNSSLVQNSVSLIITKAPSYKTAEHIRNSVERIITQNENIDWSTKFMMQSLMKSVHVFHRPDKDGKLTVDNYFLEEIARETSYIDSNGSLASGAISNKSKVYAVDLLKITDYHFRQIVNIIVEAIKEEEKVMNWSADNPLLNNYRTIQNVLLGSVEEQKIDNINIHEGEYFVQIAGALALREVLVKNDMTRSFLDLLKLLLNALEVFAEFIVTDNKEQVSILIQQYSQTLKQEVEYIKIFSELSGQVPYDYHSELNLVMERCHNIANRNLIEMIKNLEVEQEHHDPKYYETALKYFTICDKDAKCINAAAKTYYYMGKLSEKHDNKVIALKCYVQSLKLDKQIAEVYESIGDIFLSVEEYKKAITCYKAINNSIKVRFCYKQLINSSPDDLELLIEAGDYCSSIGLIEKAVKYYQQAFSFSNDENIKAVAWNKAGNVLKDTKVIGSSFIDKADSLDFYNFSDANVKEIIDTVVIIGHNLEHNQEDFA